MKKGVLRNFTKFTGKHQCQSLFFNKVAGLRPATLLKKRLWHRCFPVNFVKFLRTPFLQNTSERRLLYNQKSNFITNSGILVQLLISYIKAEVNEKSKAVGRAYVLVIIYSLA